MTATTSDRPAAAPEPRAGVLVAVCSKPVSGLPKLVRDAVTIGPHGIVGDYHATATLPPSRIFGRARALPPAPNDRTITVVAQELYDALNVDPDLPGLRLVPGDFGENLLTRGLGLLGRDDVPDGCRLLCGDRVVLRVTGQNDPCISLVRYTGQRLLARRAYGRRGLLCTVAEGAGATLRAGDPVRRL